MYLYKGNGACPVRVEDLNQLVGDEREPTVGVIDLFAWIVLVYLVLFVVDFAVL